MNGSEWREKEKWFHSTEIWYKCVFVCMLYIYMYIYIYNLSTSITFFFVFQSFIQCFPQLKWIKNKPGQCQFYCKPTVTQIRYFSRTLEEKGGVKQEATVQKATKNCYLYLWSTITKSFFKQFKYQKKSPLGKICTGLRSNENSAGADFFFSGQLIYKLSCVNVSLHFGFCAHTPCISVGYCALEMLNFVSL